MVTLLLRLKEADLILQRPALGLLLLHLPKAAGSVSVPEAGPAGQEAAASQAAPGLDLEYVLVLLPVCGGVPLRHAPSPPASMALRAASFSAWEVKIIPVRCS